MRLDYRDVNNCILRLPDQIVLQLKAMPDRLFLAGGFIRACVAGEEIKDIDLFVPDAAAHHEAIAVAPDPLSRIHTANATTLLGFDRDVQIIHRWMFNEPADVIHSFDFTICAAAIWWDGEQWQSVCDAGFYSDLAAKRLVYRKPERNEDAGGSLLRVLKYAKRGYGIPRASFAAVLARAMINIDACTDEGTLADLIAKMLSEVDPPRDAEEDEHGIRSLLKG